MNLPVSLNDVAALWENDCEIDSTNLTKAMAEIPKLHSKYLNIHAYHNAAAQKIQRQFLKAKKIRYRYYTGELNNPEDLEKYGFEPLEVKILKTEIPMYLETDHELIALQDRKAVHDDIVNYCTAVLKELNSRTYQIRSMIEWEKFINGS